MSDGRQGKLVEVVASEGRIEALAVLTLESNPSSVGEDSDAIAVQANELPLPYPLLGTHVRE